MLARLATVVACGLSFLCDGTTVDASQRAKSDALAADTVIVLQRGACEHRCAVYNVVIFSDGSAIFDGRSYVRHVGVRRTTISRDAVRRLLDAAAALRFFDLRQPLVPGGPSGCVSTKSDAPTVIVSLSSAGQANTVVHHHGCTGPDATRLAQFEAAIDEAVKTSQWVK